MTSKIPASEAEFFFRAESDQLPTEFVAAHRARRMALRHQGERDHTSHLPQSYGAHTSDWLSSPDSTPAGVFALAFIGRLKRAQVESFINGLHEMARIEGCEWALEMLAALEHPAATWRSRT